MLVQMMESQAYRELAAAHMFGYGLRFVPEKWLRSWSGTSARRPSTTRRSRRCTASSPARRSSRGCAERLPGKPVPFAESWVELAMAQFLYDRGGFWQLKEYEECSFEPYREVVQKIVKEEAGHQEPRARRSWSSSASPAASTT